MTETIIKTKGYKRATLALVLALAALATSGYLYYQSIKVYAHATYQLQSVDNATVSTSRQLQAALTTINTQIDTLKNKVSSISSDKFSANNYQLNTLISLANQSLVVYHDIPGAVKLLNYAENVIDTNNNAIYTGLKVAIASDLDKLKQLPVLDRVIIATRLNNIIINTDHLELVVNNIPIADTTVSNNNVHSKWTQFLLNIKTKLSGLVQVSSANKNNTLNLLPRHEAIIHQNIKLDVLNARMALLQNDEVNWRYSLNAAKQSLTTYFVNSPNMQNILKDINQLQLLDISYINVGIEDTVKELNKLNNLSANNF